MLGHATLLSSGLSSGTCFTYLLTCLLNTWKAKLPEPSAVQLAPGSTLVLRGDLSNPNPNPTPSPNPSPNLALTLTLPLPLTLALNLALALSLDPNTRTRWAASTRGLAHLPQRPLLALLSPDH